ncbi:hypothetical protein TWF718_008557 [Orbilia javanica]|uniref:Uncharacterized protein n=1 Tax=Orbilia javanica TaxID=47235 RepID=A0AAN8N1A0_9PEZI
MDTITNLSLAPPVMAAAQLTTAVVTFSELSRAFLEIRTRQNAAKQADDNFTAIGWKSKLERFISVVDSVLRLLNERHLAIPGMATQ